jgi:hypothetical protein
MTSEQITTFLKEHPLISQRGLETACKLPIGTIRLAMAGFRPIPSKHIVIIVEELRKYGFSP